MQLITLTTDFGLNDPCVGIMKGVIHNISNKKDLKIIDITHNISPHNIEEAAYVIQISYKYFPKGTIHICVIDPGVGSERKPVLIETSNYFFIGPNNGLFTYILENEKIENIVYLKEKKFFQKEVSNTFHGRDIFAPVAAHLANGIKVKSFGVKLKDKELIKLKINKPYRYKKSYIGQIQHIDHFGNIITNIPNKGLPKKICGKVKSHKFTGLLTSYSQGKPEKLFAIKGSHGHLEISVKKQNARRLTKVKIGDKVKVNL